MCWASTLPGRSCAEAWALGTHQDCFLCRSLSFLVKLEQLDLGGNDLEVLVQWEPSRAGHRGVGQLLLVGKAGHLPGHTGFFCPCSFFQPDTLGALPNLRELWLDRNQLSALPPVSDGGTGLLPRAAVL